MNAAWLLTLALHAAAPTPPLVLAVGTNISPDPSLPALSFADDDAAAAVELFGAQPGRAWLLTTMDAETQSRFPSLASLARPPTQAQLRLAVSQMAARLDAERKAGLQTDVVVWVVGHGAFDATGRFHVALEDGPLTAGALDAQVLTPLLAAHRIHVLLDACHAEAILASRAAIQPASAEEVSRQTFVEDLFGHSNVGFVLAAGAHQKTYEWSEMRSGVFSALARSALRGAANADGDECVTYPELTAYLSSAVQGITVADARPRVRGRPPAVDARAPLSCRGSLPNTRSLESTLGAWGAFHLEDARGVWLAGGRFEPGHRGALWLPSSSGITLHSQGQEYAVVDSTPGRLAAQETPLPQGRTPRGAAERAFKEGLFSVAYGGHFLAGYQAAALNQDPRSAPAPSAGNAVAPPPPSSRWHLLAWGALAPGVVGAVAAGATALAAAMAGYWVYRYATTDLQRPAAEARQNASVAAGVAVVGGAFTVAAVVFTAAMLLVDATFYAFRD